MNKVIPFLFCLKDQFVCFLLIFIIKDDAEVFVSFSATYSKQDSAIPHFTKTSISGYTNK